MIFHSVYSSLGIERLLSKIVNNRKRSSADLSKTKIIDKKILRIKCPESYKVKYRGNFDIDESILNVIDYSQVYEKINAEKNIAFLVIDMQKDFLKKIDPEDRKKIVKYQCMMLEYCAQKNIPAMVVKPNNYGNTIKEISDMINKVPNSDTIEKYGHSAFDGTDLHSKLQDKNIKKLYLMGINSMRCVRETAEDAIKKGYDIATSDKWIAQPRKLEDEDGGIWFSLNGEEFYTKRKASEIMNDNKDYLMKLSIKRMFGPLDTRHS
ncbi:MAG: isochorismatase family protein [Candidatus Omnitrophica bacterium]|nr:isochorismatase family protein [Candidatus Omnitrophota bacterium]